MKNKTLLFIFLFFLFSLTTAYARLKTYPLNLGYNTDNTEALAAATMGGPYDVTLSDRTIYADGSWNTLTLPFGMTSEEIAKSPLNGFTIKKLDAATSGLDGEKLTLNFTDVTEIKTGTPYIVKSVNAQTPDLVISSEADWNAFATAVNNGTDSYEGKLVRLAKDISVSTMVGTSSNMFKGTFDGAGHTLTLNYTVTENVCAPFRYIDGATIQYLKVNGTIDNNGKQNAGIAGYSYGNSKLIGCLSDVSITSNYDGDASNAGLLVHVDGGTATINNCAFTGKLLKKNNTNTPIKNGGLVGWTETRNSAKTNISNSLFAPTGLTMTGEQTIARARNTTSSLTISNCYYTQAFGEEQGSQTSATGDDLVSQLGDGWVNNSGNAVPKMITADIINPTFGTVAFMFFDADESTVATSNDGHVILNGTYGPFANTDGLLFDEHNTANGAFHAALSVAARDGYIFSGWYTDAGKTTPATSIPFAPDGSVTLYTKWKKLLTHTDIAVANIADQTYMGSAICPAINVTDGEKTLELGTDYTTTCTNNISVGTAEMTITGMGGYAGSITKTFEITTKEISIVWGKLTLFYNGTEQAPTATAEGLVNSDDCTITVSGAAKDVGTYTATASVVCSDDYKRNYKLPTENLEKTFEITYTNLATLDGNYTAQNGEILTGSLAGNYKISIADGATVTLDGVTINGIDRVTINGRKFRYEWAGITCEGDCNIILAENSVNKVKGFYNIYPGILVPEGKTLTISGTGSLDASSNGRGAGIGGYGGSVGNIVINGGTITATGGQYAVGIGSSGGSIGNISINGGTITATGGKFAAGIGGSESVGNISINGGTITATGGEYAAGIGSGYDGSVGNITISGNETKVTAIKGEEAPYSIGKGKDGSRTGTITIGGIETQDIETSPFVYPYTNLAKLEGDYTAQNGEVLTGTLAGNYKISIADGATVTLNGVTINGIDNDNYKWAGISCEGNCNIILAENSSNAVKSFYSGYPGIYVPEGKTLTISGTGSLDASSNGWGAGIGSGSLISCGNIAISGGTITATGDNSAAGIGGSFGGNVGDITISGGTVTATGGDGSAAGIGGGYDKSVGNIVISGGTVTATGSGSAAGIGGGSYGSVGNITISGNETKVSAIKGGDALYSIGKGKDGSRTGMITIGGIETSDIETSPFVYTKWMEFMNVTVANIADQIYTGSAICPAVSVTDGEKTLVLGTDYATTCTNNISVGTAVMAITGTGDYAGLITKTFEIVPKEISIVWSEQTSFIYNGMEHAPTATLDGLVNSDGCTITVSGAAKDVGTYTASATVVCKNNYKQPTENLEKTFEITYTNLAKLEGDYTAQNGEVLMGALAGNYKISIADGATVTLNGVTINGIDNDNYKWAGISCEGNCNIILAENSTNTVKGFYRSYPGIYVLENKTLTISGTGSLDASSNGFAAGIGGGYEIGCGNLVINGGTITATGGTRAAGIGGGREGTVGNIVINGGTITATGGSMATGIGSGSEGNVRNLVINGGTITTTGGANSAGIGGSYQGNVGDITISGGTITVTGGANSAGIGGGRYGKAGNIAISGNDTKVTAIKGEYAPYSIGKGNEGIRMGSITIGGIETQDIETSPFVYPYTNLAKLEGDYTAQNGETLTGTLAGNYKISIADGATVTLDGVTINGIGHKNYQWAGITCEGNCNIILAENSSNTVKGFYYYYPGIYVPENKTLTISGMGSLDASSNGLAAGIGGGYNDISSGNIVIHGGSITATGGQYAAGIGGGYQGNVRDITISGGTVTATGGMNAAGIGGGYQGTVGNITISGGAVTATGSLYAAGIGGGNRGTVENITISGGAVTATSSLYAAGIGIGYQGNVGDITISGGTVTAMGGTYGTGIGGGYLGNVRDITISGGTVTATGGKRAVGIGGGYGNSVGNITISGDETKVTAIKGEEAPCSIGAGTNGSRTGAITIGSTETPDIQISPFIYPNIMQYAAVLIIEDVNGKYHAVINGMYGGEDAVNITDDITVNSVEITREFPTGSDNAFSTTVLPFDVNTANVSGLRAVLRYNGIKNGSTISMKVLWAEKGYIKNKDGSDKEYEHAQMTANTPYLVLMKNSEFKLTSDAYPVTLKQTTPANTEIEGCNWVFRGTWKYKKWGSSCSTGKQDCDKETGFAYGFAASASEDNKIDVGTFVKVGEGAWIRPMRAYLVRKDKLQTPQFARANGAYVKRPTIEPEELPELMSIVIDGDGDENETTVIGQFNTRTGEFKMNYDRGKFDLKGRRVNSEKPNARGAYYGKKTTVRHPER